MEMNFSAKKCIQQKLFENVTKLTQEAKSILAINGNRKATWCGGGIANLSYHIINY